MISKQLRDRRREEQNIRRQIKQKREASGKSLREIAEELERTTNRRFSGIYEKIEIIEKYNLYGSTSTSPESRKHRRQKHLDFLALYLHELKINPQDILIIQISRYDSLFNYPQKK